MPTVLIAMHSFTPVYNGSSRPWRLGLLYNRDPRLAGALLRILNDDAAPDIGDKLPYAVDDETDYTLPVHGERRGLLHVGFEIRQDLIGDRAGQSTWADRSSCCCGACCSSASRPNSADSAMSQVLSREIPLVPAQSALLFIDVQNFGAHRQGGEFAASERVRDRRQIRLLLRAAGDAWRCPTCSACRRPAAPRASR